MKRFYSRAETVPVEGGFAIHLDGRPVRTPKRALLLLPTRALGEAVAAEWRAQDGDIDPAAMKATGLANAALDQIAGNQAGFAAGIAQYGESDLLCYRADAPLELARRQAAQWDPILDWARRRYDVAFNVTSGIVHVAQPPETLLRLGGAVSALDPFPLAGLSILVTLSGSLVCGLAALEGAFAPDLLWDSSELEELWQVEQWGEDAEASARRALRRTEFLHAISFCDMGRG